MLAKKLSMKKYCIFLLFISLLFSSCSITNRTMEQPGNLIEFSMTDFEYSEQIVAEATVVRVFGVDWSRLFNSQSASISLPIFGNRVRGKSCSYALYRLMEENPGYDVIIYPQYETKKFVFPIIFSKHTTSVTARLAKIKK